MNRQFVCAVVLGLSFTSVAAEGHDDLTHTAPTTPRSTMLTCKAERFSDSVTTSLAGKAYLEGVGEQILFAIIPTTQSSEYQHVSFNAWGFTPFGQVESREQFSNWALIHVGRDNFINGYAFDYNFVDSTPQHESENQHRASLRIYDCQKQNERPDWSRQKSTQKYFNGKLY